MISLMMEVEEWYFRGTMTTMMIDLRRMISWARTCSVKRSYLRIDPSSRSILLMIHPLLRPQVRSKEGIFPARMTLTWSQEAWFQEILVSKDTNRTHLSTPPKPPQSRWEELPPTIQVVLKAVKVRISPSRQLRLWIKMEMHLLARVQTLL